ncbi:unnamed protein product, partial [marine sediment metagenome]
MYELWFCAQMAISECSHKRSTKTERNTWNVFCAIKKCTHNQYLRWWY